MAFRKWYVGLFAIALISLTAGHAHPYGRGGGGFHAGGFHAGGYGGYHAGGFGGYHAGGYGGYRTGGYGAYHVGGYGGYHYGGYNLGGYRDYGGYRANDFGGYHPNYYGGAHVADYGGYRAGAVGVTGGHAAVATDFGFGHVAGARTYVASGHYTTPYSSGVLAARGAAVRGGYYNYGAFNSGWWGAHQGAWLPYGWGYANCWGWATWPLLTGWFGWNAAPIYYDYGTNIIYQDDVVYIDGQPGPTAAEYYQQAADLAQTAPLAPPADKKDAQWQSLGVFALVQGTQSDPTAVFQLAVNKAGIIRGNYYNVLTNTNLPVRGAVDKKTQRASWIVGEVNTTVYDTGIANLTKDESPLLIHFGKDRTQEWLLVRIQEKDASAPATTSVVPPPPPPSTGESTAKFIVTVPADAEVYVDGVLQTQTGTQRVFYSPPVNKGYTYNYTIRARWTQDGRPVEQTRSINFKAGDSVPVDFLSPMP